MATDNRITGVGRMSVMMQELDESLSEINVGIKWTGETTSTPVTFDEALKESGTGMYQLVLLLICGLVNMSCAISTTAVAYISSPAAEEFELQSTTKGLLNGAPFFGMMFGAYFWGIIGDVRGRRWVILGSMAMDALLSVLSCLVSNVILFCIIRMGNGFAIIGSVCMIYVYLGEFLTPNKRDSYLLYLEIFWALGMITAPVVAMVIIPSNMLLPVKYTYFKFNAWRLYILFTSLPSLIGFILVYQYPETPRYLMLKGLMGESLHVLERIYFYNHKNTTVGFSVENFTQTYSAIGFETGYNNMRPMMILKKRLTSLKNGHWILCSTFFQKITMTCIIEFCLMASYVTVLIWTPELFLRYDVYKEKNFENVNVCAASKWLLDNNHIKDNHPISRGVFLVSFFEALSTVPFVILTGIAIKYWNKKLLLFVCCGIPMCMALLITITNNAVQVEILCCIFESFTTLMEPILFCIIVEIFPSNVRGVAFSLAVMTGRLGAVFGIFIFGILIDHHCIIIFYLLAALLFIAFVAVAFLPKLKIGGSH